MTWQPVGFSIGEIIVSEYVGLFLVYGALEAAGEAASAILGLAIWLLSVSVVWVVRWYGPGKWALDERRRKYRETSKLFEDALSSGAEIELRAELVNENC